MTDIVPSRQLIQTEETRFRAAVSEGTAQKMGGSMNFLLEELYEQKSWFINGNYSQLTTPFIGIDGMEFLFTNATLLDAFMFVKTAGSSGSTSLDIKYATTPGGSFTSIFSTPPSINYQAGNFAWVYVGSAFVHTTAPVIGTTTLNAGSALRCDVLSTQGGLTLACGIVLRHQPI